MSLRILLVENSRTARSILTRHLQDRGYEVEAVGTGVEALETILHADFDLVIMDVFMPQMNGYEATQKIRQLEGNKANTIILAFTSSTSDRDKATCLEAGMNDYVIKSDNNDELFSVIAKYQKPAQGKVSSQS
jgi:CheY-like chemotaxis protein